MGVLSGPEIESAIASGLIGIDPFDRRNINPASIDLRLGRGVAVYRKWVGREHGDHNMYGRVHVIDVKEKPEVHRFTVGDHGLVLRPGVLYLMHTVERICLGRMVAVIDGKSSLGRLGIQIHITAGYFDPGWDGQGTLEVVVTHPVRVHADMRFCQMRFHSLVGDMLSYQDTGRYTGGNALGAAASAAHTQFQEKQ